MVSSGGPTSRTQQVDAVVFDLGGVVAAFRPEQRLRAFAAATGFTGSEVRSRLFESGFDPACNRGRYSLQEAYAAGILLLDHRLDQATFAECWCTAFVPDDEMLDLIGALHSRTGLLTNNGPILLEQLPARLPRVVAAFDAIVFSCQAGAPKPDPRPYRHMSAQLDIASERILFVDDSQANVEGALNAGMQAILFRDIGSLGRLLRKRGLL